MSFGGGGCTAEASAQDAALADMDLKLSKIEQKVSSIEERLVDPFFSNRGELMPASSSTSAGGGAASPISTCGETFVASQHLSAENGLWRSTFSDVPQGAAKEAAFEVEGLDWTAEESRLTSQLLAMAEEGRRQTAEMQQLMATIREATALRRAVDKRNDEIASENARLVQDLAASLQAPTPAQWSAAALLEPPGKGGGAEALSTPVDDAEFEARRLDGTAEECSLASQLLALADEGRRMTAEMRQLMATIREVTDLTGAVDRRNEEVAAENARLVRNTMALFQAPARPGAEALLVPPGSGEGAEAAATGGLIGRFHADAAMDLEVPPELLEAPEVRRLMAERDALLGKLRGYAGTAKMLPLALLGDGGRASMRRGTAAWEPVD